MTPLTIEWIEKAEGDWATASREMRARKAPNYDAVCFHAQQCAEKYLKAILQEHNLPFPKTHDLVILIELLKAVEPHWMGLKPELRKLTGWAVYLRYPGETADQDLAREAMQICRQVRTVARKSLALK